MFMKLLTRPSGDGTGPLLVRRRIALGIMSIGLLGVLVSLVFLPGSHLADFAQGFYRGGAFGILAAGIALLIRTQYLLTHPAVWKRTRIQERDERSQHITNEAAQFAGLFAFFGAAAASFLVLPFSVITAMVLVSVLFVYMLAFLAAHLWLSKKL